MKWFQVVLCLTSLGATLLLVSLVHLHITAETDDLRYTQHPMHSTVEIADHDFWDPEELELMVHHQGHAQSAPVVRQVSSRPKRFTEARADRRFNFWKSVAPCYPTQGEAFHLRKNRVSVVMAVKDRPETLPSAVASWLSAHGIHEIVIVDWGSDDPVTGILDAAGLYDDRIKVVRVEGQPTFILSRAYNLGFKVASGSLILKLDADTHLERYFLRSHPIQADSLYWYRGFWNMSTRANYKDLSPLQESVNHLNGVFFAPRKLLLYVNGFDERMCTYGHDDESLYYRMSASGASPRRYIRGIQHMDHPRDASPLRERAMLNINLGGEFRFGLWGMKNRDVTRYKFKGVDETGACVAVMKTRPPSFLDFYSEQEQEDMRKQALVESFVLMCRDCVTQVHARRLPLDTMRGMEQLYTGVRPYKYVFTVLTASPLDNVTFCTAAMAAKNHDFNLAVALEAESGAYGSPVLVLPRWLKHMDRKLLTVPGVYRALYTRRFFVSAVYGERVISDRRHIILDAKDIVRGAAVPFQLQHRMTPFCEEMYRVLIRPSIVGPDENPYKDQKKPPVFAPLPHEMKREHAEMQRHRKERRQKMKADADGENDQRTAQALAAVEAEEIAEAATSKVVPKSSTGVMRGIDLGASEDSKSSRIDFITAMEQEKEEQRLQEREDKELQLSSSAAGSASKHDTGPSSQASTDTMTPEQHSESTSRQPIISEAMLALQASTQDATASSPSAQTGERDRAQTPDDDVQEDDEEYDDDAEAGSPSVSFAAAAAPGSSTNQPRSAQSPDDDEQEDDDEYDDVYYSGTTTEETTSRNHNTDAGAAHAVFDDAN